MKIRKGFVSNSSSSSYIIGVGKLVDEKAFVEYCTKNYIIDYNIMTTKEILEFTNKWRSVKTTIGDKTFFKKEAFDGNEVMVEINPSIEEKFVSVYHGEDIEENEDGETNYDIDSDSFNNSGLAVLGIEEEDFVEDWDCIYGAGRNG